MITEKQVAKAREIFHAALRRGSLGASDLHCELRDQDSAPIGNDVAWLAGAQSLCAQLVRTPDQNIALMGRAAAAGLPLNYQNAYRLGINVLSPEKPHVAAPRLDDVRRLPVGIHTDGSVQFTVMTRGAIEASEIFQTGLALGADYQSAAALFVWITGLCATRAITKQNLEMVARVLPRLPTSFGKGGPRHWRLPVETAILQVRPTAPRLSAERCARHMRALAKLRRRPDASPDFEMLLARLDPDTSTLTLDKGERNLFLLSRDEDAYIIFIRSGRVIIANLVANSAKNYSEDSKNGKIIKVQNSWQPIKKSTWLDV